MEAFASIIVSVSSEKVIFYNFITNLSKYQTIKNYELILINDNVDYIINDELIKNMGIFNFKIISPCQKLGYGVANNLGVDYATNEYIVFMNDDIIMKNGCLEYLIEMLKPQTVGAVQPKLMYPQNNLIQSTGHVFTKYTNAHAFENSQSNNPYVNKSFVRKALTTALCATKKTLFYSMGKFDTQYYNAWEGMEYTLKLSNNGYKCIYDHRAEAFHIRGGARVLYSLDESAQSAMFWSKWSNCIDDDLNELFSLQLSEKQLNFSYTLFNFSKLCNIKSILNKSNIQIVNEISYVFNSGLKTIDLMRVLPCKLLENNYNIIYFVNNYIQVKNNLLWFSMRSQYNDMIFDLCGNVIRIKELLPNPSL